MEVLYAQVVDVGLLHDRKRVVERPLVERIPGDAEPERNGGKGTERGNRSSGKQYLLHKFPFNFKLQTLNFKLQTNMTYAIGLRNFL